ncbi:hypothetical protein OJAV_G00089470 [Oryzias javanicus]|uniref:Uncharacterized protein n=1 Tax=Oryzias javanicus TaxID=123683 RepID=A0A3S2PRZ0_ORYJA|nr:hypothetical protein OJAV_G00089470 [Oryzias javanicus]
MTGSGEQAAVRVWLSYRGEGKRAPDRPPSSAQSGPDNCSTSSSPGALSQLTSEMVSHTPCLQDHLTWEKVPLQCWCDISVKADKWSESSVERSSFILSRSPFTLWPHSQP